MGQGPFSVVQGAEGAQRADRGDAREGFLPSFGALRRDKTPTAALWLYSVLARERERSVVSNQSNPLYVAHGPPFIR